MEASNDLHACFTTALCAPRLAWQGAPAHRARVHVNAEAPSARHASCAKRPRSSNKPAAQLRFEAGSFLGQRLSFRAAASAAPAVLPRVSDVQCAKTDFKDYYATLGVSRGASSKEIKSAFRELARKCHPDIDRTPGAEAKFKEINEAYEVLSDPEKRKRYDQFGQYWKQAGGFPGGGPGMGDFGRYGSFDEFINDLLGRFAGGAGAAPATSASTSAGPPSAAPARPSAGRVALRGGRLPLRRRGGRAARGPRAARGAGPQQAAARISLSLSEAYRGTTRSIRLARPGGEENVTVRIPPGAYPEAKIRVAGRGAPDPMTGRPGDVMLACEVGEHPVFKLAAAPGGGHRLEVDLPLAPDEAALGATVDVPTPAGPSVRMQVPPGVRSGQLLRLKGKGWPDIKGGGAGDLFARVQVVASAAGGGGLSEAERALYEQLRAARSWDPRASLADASL
eukprot:tig00000551_g2024.t1